MAKPPKLPRLLHLLSPEERGQCLAWVEMVYHGRQSSHRAWFEALWKQLEAIDFPERVPQTSLNEWWLEAFPHSSLESRLMANLNLDLSSTIESYLAYLQFRNRPALFANQMLYALLRKDEAGALFASFFQHKTGQFQALELDKLDYRYYFNWAQVQFTGEEYFLYRQQKQKAGSASADPRTTETISQAAQVLYVLERALPALNQPPVQLNALQHAALGEARAISPGLVPYQPLLVSLFDWALQKMPVPPDAGSGLFRWVSLFESIMPGLQPDFAVNLAYTCLNLSRSWERIRPSPELLSARNRLNELLWQRNISPRDAITYFQLLRTQMAAVSIAMPRVQAVPDPQRQEVIQPQLEKASRVLEKISGQITSPQERLQAEQLLQTMILFEQGNDAELDLTMKKIRQTQGYFPAYETYSTWVHVKSLFLRNDPDDKLEHILSQLIRSLKRKDRADPYFSFFSGILQAAQVLKRLHRKRLAVDHAVSKPIVLNSSGAYEDKHWLESLLAQQTS